MVCAATSTSQFEAPLQAAVALSAVAPLGASAGVAVQITGTGFDPVAANNTVTLTLPGGATTSLVAETIAVVDAAKGIRRIGITLPAGVPTGTASVLVANRTTGESAGGRTLQIVSIALPEVTTAPRGAQQLAVRVTGSSNVQFVAGRTTVTFGAGITVGAIQVQSSTSLIAPITVASNAALGPRTVTVVTSTQTALLQNGFTVNDPNRSPAFTSAPVLMGRVGDGYGYQATASDPDGDPLSFRLISGPAGLSISTAGLVTWTPGATQTGDQDVTIEVVDSRGGNARQAYRIAVAAAPALQSIDVAPETFRFTAAAQTRALTVTGHRSDGQAVNLTAQSTGTTYESGNRFVATVAADGTVTAVANGDATITARNGTFSDTAAIVVEIGVTLDSLQLNPTSSTLRAAGATQRLTLTGRFSDGTSRDLTGAAGTTFTTANSDVATVAADGLVTAVANGQVTITAHHDTRQATASVTVSISAGGGFLSGEVYDDTKGLPLAGAQVALVADGGGPLDAPTEVVADDRGRFSIAGRAGDAVLRVTKPGFTTVERHGTIPVDGAATVLDSRLTALDGHANAIGSALGGTARDEQQRAVLRIAPGGLTSDASLTLTLVSPQGLAGLLPAGWSPIAAVSIEPANLSFGFPLALTIPHTLATLAAGLSPVLVHYDRDRHEWLAVSAATVDAGGATFTNLVETSGQFAVVVADAAPAPPPAITGQALAGVTLPAGGPANMTAAGDVVPRSAPPGDSARATGRLGLTASGPISSGTVVQVRVNERFDLLDSSEVHTLPFTQDLIAYSTPRPATGGSAGARFPITPSRDFSIQELMLGVIRLDVTAFANEPASTLIGASGGTITNDEGDALAVPANALTSAAPLSIRRVTLEDAGVAPPTGFSVVAAIQISAVGAAFAQTAQLSTSGTGLSTADQILVARAFTDPFNQRRLRLVAMGELVAGRLVTRTTVGTLQLDGIRGGGEFIFLRAQQPIGFVNGTVVRGAATVVPSVLVVSDSLVLADVTGAAGTYTIPVAVGVDVTLRAADAASGDTATATRRLDTAGQILATTLTLATIGPSVVATSPSAGATSVALDTPVTIDFSEPLDPASVTEGSVALQLAGTAVNVTRTVSADRRRVVLRPSSPLTAISTYSLVLTVAIHDREGNPLTAIAPITFTTIDPARPPRPAAGQIAAELPDESGMVLITGSPGVAAAGAGVTATNTRTQETSSAHAQSDGSFRVRIGAIVGDEIVLTLRGADGRDITLGITQFTGADGSTSIGVAGGSVEGPDHRAGTVLPRALSRAGIFHLEAGQLSGLPALPAGFSYADAFTLRTGDAAFRSLAALTLTESQSRFAAINVFASPFGATGELTVPADALTNSDLRFSAVAQDADGTRRSASATTTVVAATPDQAFAETSQNVDFPSVFLDAPREALPAQQISVRAIAPAARVALSVPSPADVTANDTVLLAQQATIGGQARLLLTDRLELAQVNGASVLRTIGRDLPGMTAAGDYVIVAARERLAFATGIANGSDTLVVADGLPFTFRTRGPNGRFIIPVRSNQAFTLRFSSTSGTLLGTSTGQAPTTGSIDVGSPLASAAGRLTVHGEPDERSIVDINAAVILRFSEPVDATTVVNALIVTDDAGSRVFGRVVVSNDGLVATFRPTRRWRFDTQYRYGVGTSVLARSGARLSAAFASQFRTFAPSILSSIASGETRDVAVTAGTAVLGTATGVSIVNVTSARTPAVAASVPVSGGAGAVSLLVDSPLTDRNGTTRTGPLALVGSGSTSGAGFLRMFDLANPAAPVLIGSTQLTNAPGQTPPAGVPSFVGTPRGISAGTDGRGFVAIESVGVTSINLGQAIPVDAANPARGATARYPAGAESASDVARLDSRLLVAGAGGLTVLDAATMTRLAGVNTTGNAQGVAVLHGFGVDLNGDGVVSPDVEVFDLTAVANGIDGTLQFYRVPTIGDPVLLSAVRIAGSETTSVRLDATERLAFVGLGGRGVALIDLDGPASVQPIDADHNGVDDRILSIVDTAGSAWRVALDMRRGLGYVADGPAGLAIVRLTPPRTRILSIKRDPLRGIAGDEQSIAESGELLSTDEAVQVSLEAATAGGEGLSFVISEAGSPARLAFDGGQTARRLIDGLNDLTINLDPSGSSATVTRDASLSVVSDTGLVVATVPLRILPAAVEATSIDALYVAPRPLVITADQQRAQLSVGAHLSDGRLVNVTSGHQTLYYSSNRSVATVDASGVVTAVAGGTTVITVTNGNAIAETTVTVQHAAAVVALDMPRRNYTLTGAGELLVPDITARFSDGVALPADSRLATSFATSDPNVVAVDAPGRLVAVGNGTARITATTGSVSQTFEVFVELRTPASLSAIQIDPVPAGSTTDDPPVVRGRLIGTGSLEGLAITVGIGAPMNASAQTSSSYGGTIAAKLDDVQAGTFAVTLSVVDPSSGQTRSASVNVTIGTGTSDSEPNDSVAAASPLALGRPLAGRLEGSDHRDVFRTDLKAAGTVNFTVRFETLPAAGTASIVVLSAGGLELQRQPVVATRTQVSQQTPEGPAFIAIETTTGSLSYRIETAFTQGNIAVGAIAPTNGGPGTLVTITGSGFSIDPEETMVLFGGIAGKTRAATSTQLQVEVPANAVDGPLVVISGARRAVGPAYTAGNATPAPDVTFRPTVSVVRFDPVNQAEVDVTRLSVFFEPSVTRSSVDTIAAAAGATVIGRNPALNSYVFEFAANQSLAGINARRSQLEGQPGIRRIVHEWIGEDVVSIDGRDRPGTTTSGTAAANAFRRSRIFDAIETIRSTPQWCCDRQAFNNVKVAVIDTGFDPLSLSEFQFRGQNFVHLFMRNDEGAFVESAYRELPRREDEAPSGHGTEVTSVIAAVNNGGPAPPTAPLSGALNGLFDPTEEPFRVDVYGVRSGTAGKQAAFTAIANRAGANAIDIINISWRETHAYQDPFEASRDTWRDVLRQLSGRTLIVAAAGNDNFRTNRILPAMLTSEMSWVISVGASSTDGARKASFSNHNADFVDIAAVGVDVPVAVNRPAQIDPTQPVWEGASGTSFAAPQVASVAGLLMAIRSGLTPDVLKQILIDSARDISGTWNPGNMRHLDADAAVRKLLPVTPTQPVYIANQSGLQPGDPGEITALEINPTTGRPAGVGLATDTVARLTFTRGGVTFTGRNPTSLGIAPQGDYLYAVVSSTDQTLGDGLLVVNTKNHTPEDFIALSGAAFPPVPTVAQPSPLAVSGDRPAMVISKDGRLAYVAQGTGIIIINLIERKIVRTFLDLPFEYRSQAADFVPSTLNQRLNDVRARVFAGVETTSGVRRGGSISALALSPDGKTLFAAFETGGGGGYQPGGVLPLSVDLYSDTKPDVAGLQSDLSRYMAPAYPNKPVLFMAGAGEATGGDQPTALQVSADGNYLYLLNGGLTLFSAIAPSDLDPRLYTDLMGGPGFGLAASVSGSGGLSGVTTAVNSFGNRNDALNRDLRTGLTRRAQAGDVFLAAPGYTAVFDINPDSTARGEQIWLFPSDVVTGWNPPSAEDGLIVNHLNFNEVYAARPFAIALRPPDGKRALVGYFQTGNFGVLDRDAQVEFDHVTTPNPALTGLPVDIFKAVVGVTQALPLDRSVWPRRGAFRSFGSEFVVPSPDERLLFPWQIEYAQNGRFAVATHRGNRPPGTTIDARIPRFTDDGIDEALQRARLVELGFIYSGGTTIRGPDGTQYSAGDPITLTRGGGAVSIIRDGIITTNLNITASNEPQYGTAPGVPRAFLATAPICQQYEDENPARRCSEEVVDRYYDYHAPDAKAFSRPGGVAIYPYLAFETPRFGDVAELASPVVLTWRDPSVRFLHLELMDLDGADTNSRTVPLDPDAVAARTAQAEFAAFFGDNNQSGISPHPGHRYRVTVRAMTSADDSDPDAEVSRTSITVTFGSITPLESNVLTLSPVIGAIPIVNGSTLQLRAMFKPAGNSTAALQDVTGDAATCYRWTQGATPNCADERVSEPDLAAIRSRIAGLLTPPGGTPAVFPEAPINIVGGLVTVNGPGIQLVSAKNGATESHRSVILAGFTIDRIDLEPEPLESSAETNTVGTRVAAAFGRGANAPLVIAPSDSRVIDDDGQIMLDKVTLRYVDGGKISLNDLMDSIRGLVEEEFDDAISGAFAPIGATPTWRNAQALVKLLEGPGTTNLRYTLDLTTSSVSTAFFNNSPFFKARIRSNSAGLALVTGTLDLGGFGTGSDSVLVWSLPPLQSATIDPASLTINRAAAASPGPALRATAHVEPASATLTLPSGFPTTTAAVEAVLPRTFTGTFTQQLGTDFHFEIAGSVSASGQTLQLTGFTFAFDAPNIQTAFFTSTWSSADTAIVGIGAQEEFAQHVVHGNTVGITTVNYTLQIDGLGSTNGHATVEVCDCPAPEPTAAPLEPTNEQVAIHWSPADVPRPWYEARRTRAPVFGPIADFATQPYVLFFGMRRGPPRW